MRISIATPLYPPDIADPAGYVKELATRLASNHKVTVITYGRIPEKVPGVTIHTTNKHLPAVIRLIGFTYNLIRSLNNADILYVQSGVSAELPSLIARVFSRAKILIRITTPADTWLKRIVRKNLTKNSGDIPADEALTRPEIVPFTPHPTEAFDVYERAWRTHIEGLTV